MLLDGTIQKIVNCGGVNGQRYVMNICLCIIKLIIVLMKSRENTDVRKLAFDLSGKHINLGDTVNLISEKLNSDRGATDEYFHGDRS